MLKIHGQGREEYEFEVLPNEEGGDFPQRQAGELYDAFVEEDFVRNTNEVDGEFPGKERRRSGDVGDEEVGQFLADVSDDEELLDEKGIQRLLRG